MDAYEKGLKIEHVASSKGISYVHMYYRMALSAKNTKQWEKAISYFDMVRLMLINVLVCCVISWDTNPSQWT